MGAAGAQLGVGLAAGLTARRRNIGDFGRVSRPHRGLPSGPERLNGSSRARSAAGSLESQPREARIASCGATGGGTLDHAGSAGSGASSSSKNTSWFSCREASSALASLTATAIESPSTACRALSRHLRMSLLMLCRTTPVRSETSTARYSHGTCEDRGWPGELERGVW